VCYLTYSQPIGRVIQLKKTAVLDVLSDVLTAVDKGNMAALALLDLSSAFDSVDHDTVATTTDILWFRRRRT